MKEFLRKARGSRKIGGRPMGKYALIGEKLSHSFSSEIHGRIFKEMGINGTYELIEMEKNHLEEGVERLVASGFDGFNVTIPYKESIIPFLHEMSPEAKAIGAVNTVKIEAGRMKGFNTDIYGFETMVGLGGLHVTPETRVLVIGTGGAAKTAAHWLEQRTKRVWFLSRTSRKSMRKLGTFQVVERKDKSVIRMMDLVVNCSPRGMFPNMDELPIDASLLGRVSMAVDLVYNPMRTLFIQEMERKKCLVANGLHMLVAQAIQAQEIWNGVKIGKDAEKRLIEDFHSEQINPVLIGMPGSGKSSVGKHLAELMGREFVDTDELIEKIHGPITEIFAVKGEKGFRAVEREAVKSLRNSKNIVIATGGGAVLDPLNVVDLKLNGKLIYLDRPLNQIKQTLETGERPLLKGKNDLENLYGERRQLYEDSADLIIGDAGNSGQQAIEIQNMLKKKIF